MFERVTTEDHLREVLEIAANTFTDDRFLVDPKLGEAQKISSARYQAYVRQSFVRADERVYRLVNPTTQQTVAFKTHRIVSPDEALMLLGGVHTDYKSAGLAAINAYHEFNEMMKNGVKRFTTHVSARNYGVMNLEISGFQYRIKQTFVVLRSSTLSVEMASYSIVSCNAANVFGSMSAPDWSNTRQPPKSYPNPNGTHEGSRGGDCHGCSPTTVTPFVTSHGVGRGRQRSTPSLPTSPLHSRPCR